MGTTLTPQVEKDLKATIRDTLRRRSHRAPSERTVQDIFEIVIHASAQYRFEEIQRRVDEWAARVLESERRGK